MKLKLCEDCGDKVYRSKSARFCEKCAELRRIVAKKEFDRTYHQRPYVKSRKREYYQRPEVKARVKEYGKKYRKEQNKIPGVKARKKEYMKEYYQRRKKSERKSA